ncbi:MAG: hypothetical protein FJ102_15380 [Deltaproteobacteria bacterium]|nr:hypothetical protein [Deltaproteobacteria bacterium]
MLVIAVAITANALAWGIVWSAYRRWPVTSLVALCTLWALFCVSPWWVVVNAVDQYTTGRATLVARGLLLRVPNPDPVTRLPYLASCTAGPYAEVHNWALRWIVDALGPMPGAYLGPYPSRDVYLELIEAPDVVLTRAELDSGLDLELHSSTFRFPELTEGQRALVAYVWHATPGDKVALRYLSDDSLLVGDRVLGGIWVRRDDASMYRWADYTEVPD